VHALSHTKGPIRASAVWLAIGVALVLGIASCKSPHVTERRAETRVDPGWPRANNFFHQVSYQAVKAAVPKLEGAEYVKDDGLCVECHPAYGKAFANNVHRGDGCESCHGPASKHMETRGKEPGMIFGFKAGDPVVRAEACLRCHEEDPCTEGARWRTSKHAQCGTTCVDCHRGHYDVPPGTPATVELNQTASRSDGQTIALTSHVTAPQPKESAKPKLPSLKGTSNHMGAVAPGICYRCHQDMTQYQQIAGPHQICGPNGFNCTTCHDAHGQIREESRKDLCLQCHSGAPTMAWHSSTHNLNGVGCTDCHNPHPRTCVPQVVNVSHYGVERPKRLQMAVDQPRACYRCHQKIYGRNALPSHHPIKEGKMVCSDCHDAHGQTEGNLKEASVNLVCYRCHAEKQGPFVFEHPPVTENCAYCHEPHGTVANNLLRQPSPMLCLRCHAGHHNGRQNLTSTTPTPLLGDDKATVGMQLRQGLYTNCAQCHPQVHGTNRISNSGAARFTR
jgi:DmsE family decaheme c-type cytochrome